MNDLLDRFFELENRQRIMLCVAAIVVVLAGYWYIVLSGRRAEMTSLETKITNLREQRDAKAKLVANLDATRDAVRELQAQVREAEVRLPDEKEIPDLLSNVS